MIHSRVRMEYRIVKVVFYTCPYKYRWNKYHRFYFIRFTGSRHLTYLFTTMSVSQLMMCRHFYLFDDDVRHLLEFCHNPFSVCVFLCMIY